MSKFVASSDASCVCASEQCPHNADCVLVTLHIPKGVLADPTATRDRLIQEANSLYFSLILQRLRQCDANQFNAVMEAGASAISTTLPNFSGI